MEMQVVEGDGVGVEGGVSVGARRGVWVLALVALGLGLGLLPWRSDGAALVSDGLWYGWNAEHAGVGGVTPHHPGFDAGAWGLARGLGALGLEGAGHWAVRMLAGLGLAGLVLLLGLGAGGWCGVALAAAVVATRGFVVETAVGENVVPACAAVCAALWWAGTGRRAVWVAGWCLLALVLRQDAVLAMPGVMVAGRFGKGRWSWGKTIGVLGGVGVVTAGVYFLVWRWVGTEAGWWDWLTLYGRQEQWLASGPMVEQIGVVAQAFGLVIGDVRWPRDVVPALVGLGWVTVILLAAILAPGRGHGRGVLLGALVIVVLRAPFYLWFEPWNYEWQMLPVALVGVVAAAVMRGEAATGWGLRAAAMVLLVAVTGATLAMHGPETVALRQERLMTSAEKARTLGGEACRYFAHGKRAATALHLLGVPAEMLPGGIEQAMGVLSEAMAKRQVPTVVLLDRWSWEFLPGGLRGEGVDALAFLDEGLPQGAVGAELEGRVVALGWEVESGK